MSKTPGSPKKFYRATASHCRFPIRTGSWLIPWVCHGLSCVPNKQDRCRNGFCQRFLGHFSSRIVPQTRFGSSEPGTLIVSLQSMCKSLSNTTSIPRGYIMRGGHWVRSPTQQKECRLKKYGRSHSCVHRRSNILQHILIHACICYGIQT